MERVLSARRLTVRVPGGRAVLADVDIDVAPGELVALLGPNGSGKSTLLRALAGELRPSGGEVSLDGAPLTAYPAAERARRLGVLPQSSSLAFPFAVEDVVALGRLPHAGRGESRHDRDVARRALALVELSAFGGRAYPTLSGGERQRVHLARVLAQLWDPPGHATRALLLDEPTASLDLRHHGVVLQLARAWARAGAAVLVSLHDLAAAARHADRVVVLHDGRVAAVGPPRAVLGPRLLSTVFGVEGWVEDHPVTARPQFVLGTDRRDIEHEATLSFGMTAAPSAVTVPPVPSGSTRSGAAR
jgi:iron complex transport system ATP-binding protein